MQKVKMQTPVEHANSVIWLLALVDDMREILEAQRDIGVYDGLCHALWRSASIGCLSRIRHLHDRQQIVHSMEALMRKHIKPDNRGAYWFGIPCKTNFKLRCRRLNHLRYLIAAGNIDPRS